MIIGYAQQGITPSLERPVYLAGFAQNRLATEVHDELTVRALALREDGRSVVLVALDLIGFFQFHVQEVIRRVRARTQEPVPPDILIASLHPHDGPDTMGLWGPDTQTSGVDPLYLEQVIERSTQTILAALADRREAASLKTASLRVPGLAKNARDAHILDDELAVLQFLDRDGKPLVSLFDFACHPEVLWEHNTRISADYVGYLRQAVERQTGAACIFFSGALGGMMTPDVKDHSFEECRTIGEGLASAGLEALAGARPVLAQGLSFASRPVQAKLTNILYKLAFGRKLLRDVRDRRGFIHSQVNLIKIGPAWFATLPGELLPKLGLRLKEEMKASGAGLAAVICLANDELGYILPPEDFRFPLNPFKPGKHYEETNSIGRGIAPAVLDGLRELLHG
jgi:hypothetical protein